MAKDSKKKRPVSSPPKIRRAVKQFKFSRGRGIVWVCDIADSSKFLNANEGADQLEVFLPRFYWISSLVVEAAGGKFLKWTGDGFLAWFEVNLHRELGARAAKVFEALWHLSILVNVTQLAVKTDRRLRIRHGVAYEQDALMIESEEDGGATRLDIIGRAVVLAFRLSGVSAQFPHAVAQGDVVSAYQERGKTIVNFARWRSNADDRLRYFKGERWGTQSLFTSCEKRRRTRSAASLVKMGERAIAKADGQNEDDGTDLEFALRFMQMSGSGPEWCRDTLNMYMEYLRKGLFGTLKEVVQVIKSRARPIEGSSRRGRG